MNRVVITGLGVISAAGNNAAEFWKKIRAGKSCIRKIVTIPTEKLNTRIAAEVTGFDPLEFFGKRQRSLLDRFSQFGLVAAREAIGTSGIVFEGECAERTGVIIGSGVGGQNTLDEGYWALYGEEKPRVHPFTVPRLMINAATSHITMEHGITGPAYSIASACSSANHAMGQAFLMIRSGMIDVAVTGGTEAAITFGTLKGWESLRVMANDTCRPFSKGRNGMVLGEGAGVFIFENLMYARKRGASIYAEVVGHGLSSDAMDITLPNAKGAARAISGALRDAKFNPEDIAYINAHGTGTKANDVTETEAIKMVFGEQARKLTISSTKSMIGHALGASGALELAATILAIRDGVVPPTANYLEPDPECDLDYIPNESREIQIDGALSNSFAFGGLNAVIALKRFL